MTVAIAPYPIAHFHANDGTLLSGGKLFTYSGGTTSKLATYTDSTGGTPNTNPIILNSRGETPHEVWLTASTNYDFVLAPANDTDPPTNAFWTAPNIQGV